MASATLSPSGAKLLARHEATIAGGIKTFLAVGNALTAIRDGQLYREGHESFEVYCRRRWNMSDRRARQLMDAAEIGTVVPVENEAQARAAAPLKNKPAALREAVKAASQDGKPTAKKIAAEVAKRVPATHTSGSSESGPAPDAAAPSVDTVDESESSPSSSGPNAAPSVIDTTSRETVDPDACPFCKGTGRKWVQAS